METEFDRFKVTCRGWYELLKNTRYLKYRLLGQQAVKRSQEFTLEHYSDFWAQNLDALRNAPRLASIEGKFQWVSQAKLDHYFIGAHFEQISQLLTGDRSNTNILEVGAGYGRNLLVLSHLFQNVQFHGLEYSPSGEKTLNAYAQRYQTEIKDIANGIAKYVEKEPVVSSYKTGDARQLPYPDQSFDLSYTNLVIEQIPREEDHLKVFSEMRRVTRKYCLFLEPWRDAQNAMNLSCLEYMDYFRGSSNLLKKAGFKSVHFQKLNFQHNLKFKLGYVVAEI